MGVHHVGRTLVVNVVKGVAHVPSGHQQDLGNARVVVVGGGGGGGVIERM